MVFTQKKLIKIILTTLLLSCFSVTRANNVLNIYCWSDYLPQQVINQFEKQTGIHINITDYDSNETLYAKLKADPKIGYDIIVPSNYYVERMRDEGMLQAIPAQAIPNRRYIDPILLNQPYDPDNRYSYPYLMSLTGIVVNKKFYQPHSVQRWSDLWQARFKNQLLLLDDTREVFAIAMLKLGYSVNDENPKHIHQAYLTLRKLMANVKLFNSDAEKNIYIDEDATIGMGWNGDIFQAQQTNHALDFIYPKDGYAYSVDCMAIPRYAPHVNNARKFINFINQPQIALEISLSEGYSSPNRAARELLPPDLKHNKIFNPTPAMLKRGQIELNLNDKALALYAKYWQLLKLST